jgi:hypothetical protein
LKDARERLVFPASSVPFTSSTLTMLCRPIVEQTAATECVPTVEIAAKHHEASSAFTVTNPVGLSYPVGACVPDHRESGVDFPGSVNESWAALDWQR